VAGSLLTPELRDFYNPEGSIAAAALVDLNSGNAERGICALPFIRQRDNASVWFPVNIIGNLYVSNGMSAANTPPRRARRRYRKFLKRHIKSVIIAEGTVVCRTCRKHVNHPLSRIQAAWSNALRAAGFGLILVKDRLAGRRIPRS